MSIWQIGQTRLENVGRNPDYCKELKLSQSTIRRALKDLRKAGLIKTQQRYRTKGGKSSLLYKIKEYKFFLINTRG
jgi:predicted transcriptional regulator